MLSNFDTLKLAVETVHPNNTVLLDDMGMPSVMMGALLLPIRPLSWAGKKSRKSSSPSTPISL